MTGQVSDRVGRVGRHFSVPVVRSTYALVVATTVGAGLGLVYWTLAARYYSPSEVGRSAAAISTMMLLTGFAQLNLNNVLPRFLPLAGQRTRQVILVAYASCIAVSVLLASAVAATLGRHTFLSGETFGVAAVYVLSVAAWSLYTVHDSVLPALRAATVVAVEALLFALAKIVMLIVLSGPEPHYGLFLSWIVPVVVAFVPINLLVFLRFAPRNVARVQGHHELPPTAELRRYVLGDYVAGVVWMSTTNVLPVLVVARLGAEQNAYFYAAWVLAGSFDMVFVALGSPMLVEGARTGGDRQLTRTAARIAALLVVPAAVAVVVLADVGLGVLGDAYAADGATVLRLVAIAMVFRLVVAFWTSLARLRRAIRSIVTVHLSLAIGVVIGVWVLGGKYGLAGVGMAYLGGQTLAALAVLPAVIRAIRHHPAPDDAGGPPAAESLDLAGDRSG
jgi:O-antigen/teichoic acid export membrane protein